jgi:geranylgeranyl transferase type-2 subunit beta
MAGAPESTTEFVRDKHVAYVVALDAQRDSYEHVVTEHLRMSGVYWGLSALEVVAAGDALDKAAIVRFVASCRHAGGGYGGNVGHDPHLLYTLSALQLLALCGALPREPGAVTDAIDVDATVRYLAALQQPDGSFAGDAWGEIDTRFSYCALQAAALLGRLDALDVPAAVEFVLACRNFDGGFGAVPGAESHAGQVFCCVGALSIAGALGRIDADTLGWWLAERQVDSGGLNGRPEKQSDVCYSWWILSALSILGRVGWIDGPALVAFILACQDPGGGGIADRPGNVPDVFHTFFGCAGLSLLGHLAGAGVRHEPIDPTYALPAALVASLGLPRQVLTLSGEGAPSGASAPAVGGIDTTGFTGRSKHTI